MQDGLLSAGPLGLGATVNTWRLLLESRFRAVLGVPRLVKTYPIIPVGWPRGRFRSKRRIAVEQVIHRQRW